MDESELAAAHDANFLAAIGLLADVVEGGFRQSFGQVEVAATRAPVAFFNAIFLSDPRADRIDDSIDDVRQAVDLMRAERLPFVVHVRKDVPNAVAAVRSLGLVAGGVLPCFGMEPRGIPLQPAELSISRVDGGSFKPFMVALVAGFGMPIGLAEKLFPIRILDQPGLRGYLGSVKGEPVATAMSMRTRETLGIYSVATLPEARGRGYGTALTWATLADADPGVQALVLQASDLGRPVYERMGFRLVREFLELGEG